MSRCILEADTPICHWEKKKKRTNSTFSFLIPSAEKPNDDVRAEEFRFVRRMDTSLRRNTTPIQITKEYADHL